MPGQFARLIPHSVFTILSAVCFTAAPVFDSAAWAKGIVNIELSGVDPTLAASVPVIAVEPGREDHVAVAWRYIAPLAKQDEVMPGAWVCEISISDNAGRSFHTQRKDWGREFTRCNAPYAAFSSKGDLYIGATLAGEVSGPPPSGAQDQRSRHRLGAAVLTRSNDDGKSWGETQKIIGSEMRDKFAPAPFLPPESIETPWDGARAVVDPQTGAVYVTGAYPAPPGATERSQRFLSASVDGGVTFGPIRTFGAADWPERWDGDIAAAHGLLGLSYIGEATPDPDIKCLCAIFAVSRDGGVTLRRSVVAAGDFDMDTLVHYPEIAADPSQKGRFVMALISADKTMVSSYLTADEGVTWHKASPAQPADIATVSRPAVAFSAKGVLVLAWRGYHPDGSYDIYAAAQRDNGTFGQTVKISTESSHMPDALKTTYALRGDFHTGLAAGKEWVHLAWSDMRNGKDMRLVYARVPLSVLMRRTP